MEKRVEPKRTSKSMRRREARLNGDYKEYCASIKTPLVTTRFNTNTWNENIEYRKKHGGHEDNLRVTLSNKSGNDFVNKEAYK